MKETNVQQLIRLEAAKLGLKLFRNNIGKLKDATGRWVSYGVGGNGGSDLLGWNPIIITKEMVGKTVAVFTAIEVKKKGGKATDEQINFIKQVNNDGGIAFICDDEKKIKLLLTNRE